MASALSSTTAEEWVGEDVHVDDVERELALLRGGHGHEPELRTSVMTHLAWIPPEWAEAAYATFAGLGEQYPSRTILLHALPEEPDGLDARVSLHCFESGGDGRNVCTEVVELTLRGARSEAPASVVAPLLLPDIPVFLRWRGQPPFGDPTFERLAETVDRLVVDSREWSALRASYGSLARYFGDDLAVTDIVWGRTLPWRESIAAAWPGVATIRELRVVGPVADAVLLAGWLRSRLKRAIALNDEPADEVEAVWVDGREIDAPDGPRPTAGGLLSAELDQFGRDPVYEAAVREAAIEHVGHDR